MYLFKFIIRIFSVLNHYSASFKTKPSFRLRPKIWQITSTFEIVNLFPLAAYIEYNKFIIKWNNLKVFNIYDKYWVIEFISDILYKLNWNIGRQRCLKETVEDTCMYPGFIKRLHHLIEGTNNKVILLNDKIRGDTYNIIDPETIGLWSDCWGSASFLLADTNQQEWMMPIWYPIY